MEQITYLLGAGASRKCLPIVSEMSDKIEEVTLPASFWIDIHCVVEKEHCKYGLKAIEIAMENYTGNLLRSDVQKELEKGYKSFCDLQYQMMEYCCDFPKSCHSEIVLLN